MECQGFSAKPLVIGCIVSCWYQDMTWLHATSPAYRTKR